MKCHDFNSLLAHSKRPGLRGVPGIYARFDLPAGAEMPSTELLRQLELSVMADLRPVRPLAPRPYFLAAFLSTFVLIVVLGVYRLGAFGIPAMNIAQNVGVLGALAAGACLLAWSIVQQMGPGSRHRLPPAVLPIVVIICLALVMAGFFSAEDEENFWTQGWTCLRSGTPFGLLAAIPFWFLLRRGAILSPRVAGAATGLLAGLVGTTALEIYCPILELSHILTWHLGVAILGAVVGFFVGFLSEISVGRPATEIISRLP